MGETQYTLKLLTPNYAEQIAILVRKDYDYLAEFLPRPKPDMSTADEISFITMKLEEFAKNTSLTCVIVDHQNCVYGVIDVHNYSRENRRGEVGYRLGSEYAGRGIISTAVSVFSDAVNRHRGCHKLSILAQTDNPGSNRVAEKSGFRFVCVLRQHLMQNATLRDFNLYEKMWE